MPIKVKKPLTFEAALRRVMQVSKQDIERLQGNKEAMEWVKEKRGPKARQQPVRVDGQE